ncbi:hypothetical protein BA768_03245 [Chryseobacterium sp. CBo1]|uniref:hypothetical protein n=1 Tax=Chryseobacterium sp. CBo1 TaxID=1869230 RepID=UPI000810D85F|nr:hypothetical protein [Chryseobacterium sp. CBo1]OCK51739.1 hypothetical protein BA768_03245 [Chryseobacterium sp. CBo1]
MPRLQKIKFYLYKKILIKKDNLNNLIAKNATEALSDTKHICASAINCGSADIFLTNLNIQFGKNLPLKINHEMPTPSIAFIEGIIAFSSDAILQFKITDNIALIHNIKTLVKMKQRVIPLVAILTLTSIVKSQIAIGKPTITNHSVSLEFADTKNRAAIVEKEIIIYNTNGLSGNLNLMKNKTVSNA